MTPLTSIVVAVVVLIIYFIPAGIAQSRKHRNTVPITLVNLFFGWTVLGWIVALVWANSANVGTAKAGEPTPETHVKCPDCAELILRDAKVCKHCGCRLVPQ